MFKFLLSVLLVGSTLFSQDIIVFDKNKFYFKDHALYYKDSGKLVNGVVRDTKDIRKARKYYESTYVNGKKNGLEKYFYKRKLSSKAMYKDGYKDGMEFIIRNGKVKTTEFYKNKKRLERIVYYNYDKKIIKARDTEKNGIQHKIRYTKSGEILYDCTKKYPKIVKKCVAYYPSGELLAEITPNGKNFSGFVYNKNGDKAKATKKEYVAMYNDYIAHPSYIKKHIDTKF